MAHQTVTIRGQVTNPLPDKVVRGYIEPTSRVVDTETHTIGLGTVRFTADAAGFFEVVVPATDNPDLEPQGFTYRLGLRSGTLSLLEVVFAAPAVGPTPNGPEVGVVYDIADLAQVGVPLAPSQYADIAQRLSSLEGGDSAAGVSLALTAHVASPTPHPAYDVDLQDLTTLLENGMT